MIKEYIDYLRDNPNHYWFKRKLYCWGWTPATREGWFVLLLWVILFISLTLVTENNWIISMLGIFFITSLLIYVCYKKGEKPQWQWGREKKNLK